MVPIAFASWTNKSCVYAVSLAADDRLLEPDQNSFSEGAEDGEDDGRSAAVSGFFACLPLVTREV